MVGQSRARQGKLTECLKREGRVRRSHVAPQETDAGWNLASKPQPSGDTQINKNELTKDIIVI